MIDLVQEEIKANEEYEQWSNQLNEKARRVNNIQDIKMLSKPFHAIDISIYHNQYNEEEKARHIELDEKEAQLVGKFILDMKLESLND